MVIHSVNPIIGLLMMETLFVSRLKGNMRLLIAIFISIRFCLFEFLISMQHHDNKIAAVYAVWK